MHMGVTVSVISGKGGTGKTTLCAGIAACLAAEGKRVLCIDADIGLRNLDIALGMAEQPAVAFTDVTQGFCKLSDAAAIRVRQKNVLCANTAERPLSETFFAPKPQTMQRKTQRSSENGEPSSCIWRQSSSDVLPKSSKDKQQRVAFRSLSTSLQEKKAATLPDNWARLNLARDRLTSQK